MKSDVINVQASVRAQLQNKAKESNRPFAEVLQYYGMERFLYRFSKSTYARQFILKGALMFTAWNIPERRTTLDIDFLARCNNQITNIEKVIREICEIAVVRCPNALVIGLFGQQNLRNAIGTKIIPCLDTGNSNLDAVPGIKEIQSIW